MQQENQSYTIIKEESTYSSANKRNLYQCTSIITYIIEDAQCTEEQVKEKIKQYEKTDEKFSDNFDHKKLRRSKIPYSYNVYGYLFTGELPYLREQYNTVDLRKHSVGKGEVNLKTACIAFLNDNTEKAFMDVVKDALNIHYKANPSKNVDDLIKALYALDL